MSAAFTTWKHKGVTYLATASGHIIDERGRNYGNWVDADNFRKAQKITTELDLGYAELRVVHTGQLTKEDPQ